MLGSAIGARWRGAATPTVIVGIVVSALGVAYFAWLGKVIFPIDDAYITQRNAEFLFSGRDPAWPDATPLHGATSVVHVGAIALLALLVPVATAQAAVGIVGGAFYAAGLAELAKVHGLGRRAAVAIATIGIATPWVAHQLVNGLETGLALAVVTWMLVAVRWSETKLHRLFPALAGLAPFVRPELALFSTLLLASFAVDRFRRQRAAFRGDLARIVLWSLATALPFMLVLVVVTDSPLPLTIEAKHLWFAESCWRFTAKLWRWSHELGTALPLFGPAVLGLCLLPLGRHGWALFAFATMFLVSYLWQFPSAIGHYHHRYLFLLLPLLLAGIIGVAARSKRAGMVLGGASFAYALLTLPSSLADEQRSLRVSQEAVVGVADWLRTHAAPGSTVLVHDAGYVATVPGLRFVDLVGLKTPSSVDVHREVTLPTCGRARAVAEDIIARAAKPTYLVVIDGWDRGYRLVGGLRSRGWDVVRADPERGSSMYAIYTLAPPDTVALLSPPP